MDKSFGGFSQLGDVFMDPTMVKTLWNNMRLLDYIEAKRALNEAKKLTQTDLFSVALLYKVGFVNGKRAERARRKKCRAG